jgi:hypothetical protein
MTSISPAGTAKQEDLMQWLITFTILGTGCYLLSCAIWPYKPCRLCDGSKRHMAVGTERAYRRCLWCKGSGERLRLGRKVLNRMHR